jgi:hypothetical protein
LVQAQIQSIKLEACLQQARFVYANFLTHLQFMPF